MKLAPSCLSHILIRKTLPFPETPGCHTTQDTRGATDNHRNYHQSAVLGGQVTYRQLKMFILPSAFTELLVSNSLLFCFGVLQPVLFLHPFSVSFREGWFWFDSPSLPAVPQTGREKKKNEDTFEYNVTYQVPSHYRTVFREREKTPESSKRIGPLQFPLIQPSQETFLYDQANDDTCYLLYAYSNPSPMCNALQGLSCSLLATLWGSDSNKSPFCRWRGICPRSLGSLVADLRLNFRSKIKPIKTVLITTQLFSFPWPVLGVTNSDARQVISMSGADWEGTVAAWSSQALCMGG